MPRSSPADLPVPTQMPSPSSAFRDEEVTGLQLSVAGCGGQRGLFLGLFWIKKPMLKAVFCKFSIAFLCAFP